MKTVVKIVEADIASRKLVLSIEKAFQRPEVGELSDVPQTKWFQSIVQSVSKFGVFVRPAGFDSVGKFDT